MAEIEEAFSWWRKSLRGERGELTPGKPKCGYYRLKNRAIAIKLSGGEYVCEVSSGYQPWRTDEIDDLFGFCSANPISYPVYAAFLETGKWPESIDDDLQKAWIGHNLGAPHEELLDEIETVIRAFTAWLKEIGGEIRSEEHDKKGEEFKTRIMTLAKQASESRIEAKRPFLEGGRQVDKVWSPVESKAEDGKSAISTALTPYRVARQKIRDEESKLLAEVIKDSPIPVHRAPKPRTGLRTTRVAVVDDIQKASAQLATMKDPPEDFIEAVRSVAKRLIDAGISVDGVHIEEVKRA